MTFKVDVANKHIPRLARRLGYTTDPALDPAAFKLFVEEFIIAQFKKLVKSEALAEEQAKIDISVIVVDADFTSVA